MEAMQISLDQQQEANEQFKVNVLQIPYASGVPQGFTSNRDNEFIYDYFWGIRC